MNCPQCNRNTLKQRAAGKRLRLRCYQCGYSKTIRKSAYEIGVQLYAGTVEAKEREGRSDADMSVRGHDHAGGSDSALA